MHKIDTDTAVGNEFVDGNAAASIRATRLNAKWFNTIQRELCNIVQKAGMALSDSDDGQVFSAILKYIKDNGIDGIKKAFSFETGDKKTEVEAGSVTFSENGTSYGIFIEDDSIHFGGPSVFEDTVDFLGGIDSLTIHKDLTVNGNFNASGFKVNDVIRMYKEVLATQKATFGTSSRAVVIEDGSVTVDHDIESSNLRAKKYASASFGFINPIYLAENKSELDDPSTLLSNVKTNGLMALVKNGTGQDYVLSRQTGSDFMKIVVHPGEILQFVYDGSEWVHSW